MAKVKVAHKGLGSDDAKDAPKREPVAPGQYAAQTMGAVFGPTRHSPPLEKVSVEFQILYGIGADGDEHDETFQGRRVYQDYILEPDPSMPDLNDQRRFELRQLLDATAAPFDDDGFDTDDLINKTVHITIKHRKGKQPDDDGHYPVFTNVTKVDTAEKVEADDLV
jgi:hypothetical protein